jgi:hypothetical protein
MNAAELRAEADRIEKQEKLAEEVANKLLNKHTKNDWYVLWMDQGIFRGHLCKSCRGVMTKCLNNICNRTDLKAWILCSDNDTQSLGYHSGHSATCAVPEVERLLKLVRELSLGI